MSPGSHCFQPPYEIVDISEIPSPSLLIYLDLVDENLHRMVEIAGSSHRLRPHCKTHKMPAIVAMEASLGIAKHKCATIAEAEMLAIAGAKDILIAYNMVGPNISRLVALIAKYPETQFGVTVDHSHPLRFLSEQLEAADVCCRVWLDIETGMKRTGIAMSDHALRLYDEISRSDGVVAMGLHVYDGHFRQSDPEERRGAVNELWDRVYEFRNDLLHRGFPIHSIVAGGTGTFPMWSAIHDDLLELSPGTPVFYDAGYVRTFPDLPFVPAAAILTRAISRPSENRITFDVGHKAIAGDPPAGSRAWFPEIPDAKEVVHSEEHLVIESANASRWQPGDETLAIPVHVCPTVALHEKAYGVRNRRIESQLAITSRCRKISI